MDTVRSMWQHGVFSFVFFSLIRFRNQKSHSDQVEVIAVLTYWGRPSSLQSMVVFGSRKRWAKGGI